MGLTSDGGPFAHKVRSYRESNCWSILFGMFDIDWQQQYKVSGKVFFLPYLMMPGAESGIL